MVAFNYARTLNTVGQYQKAIQIAEEGQQTCLDYGHYLSLPGLLALQAECHHRLGDDSKSRDYYLQAYYLMKITKNESNLEILKRKAKKEIDLEFDN